MTQQQIKVLNKAEKDKIGKTLNAQFGIKSISGKILSRGREKLIIFTGDFGGKEIREIEYLSQIEGIGNYFGKIDDRTGEIRLSIESTQLLQDQITKNIFEIQDEKQLEQWMSGSELNIATGMKGFVVMKYKNDFLGCGKASAEKIGNFIPKPRRLVLK